MRMTFGRSYRLSICVLAFLALLSASKAAINVTISDGAVIADTTYSRYEIRNGIFIIYFRSVNGSTDSRNRAQFYIDKVIDNIWWTSTQNSSGLDQAPPEPGYGCNYTFVSSRMINFTHRYEVSQDGSTKLIVESDSGHGCHWVQSFILVDKPTLYITEKLNFTVHPWEVKIEIAIRCEWKKQILAENPSFGPDFPLYLRARKVNPWATFSFVYDDPINPTETRFPKSNQSAYASFPYHVGYSCYQNMTTSTLPPRALSSHFNFSAVGGLRIPTEFLRAGIFFLAWAVADGEHYTHVDADIDYHSATLTPNNVTASALLTTEFANELWYDPTMEFLFVTPDPPGDSPQTMSEIQSMNVAIPIAVTIVAVVVVAAIAVGVYFGRKKVKVEQQRIQRAAQKSIEEDQANRERAETVAATSVSRKNSQWQSSKPSTINFKYHAEDH